MIVDVWTVVTLIYFSGVVLGTIRGDAPALPRLGLALLWPLGPLAFAVTVATLLAASLIAFPMVGALVLVVAIVIWIAV